MDIDLKTKWIAALRSGEFKQTRKRYEADGAYCCLGVLCVVADLPVSSENAGKLFGVGNCCNAINRNDGLGFEPQSFAQIANWLESQP